MYTSRVQPLNDIVSRVRREFLEMPGLRLTEPQARRLWTLEPSLCTAALTTLVDSGFLLQTPDGAFLRVDIASPVKSTKRGRTRGVTSAA